MTARLQSVTEYQQQSFAESKAAREAKVQFWQGVAGAVVLAASSNSYDSSGKPLLQEHYLLRVFSVVKRLRFTEMP